MTKKKKKNTKEKILSFIVLYIFDLQDLNVNVKLLQTVAVRTIKTAKELLIYATLRPTKTLKFGSYLRVTGFENMFSTLCL